MNTIKKLIFSRSVLAIIFIIISLNAVYGLDVECYLCQLTVEEIEKYINSNATITEIEQYVESVCNVFPSYLEMCESFIKEYIPYIINYLESNFSPKVICEYIGYCTNQIC